MNNFKRKPLKLMTLIGSLLISGVIVSACGGGGGSSQSAGVGGTGVSTARGYVQGQVTGFGSIYVNGDEFNTDTSKFFVDGNPDGTQDDFAIGMIVTLEVETREGVYTGKAFNVIYDDEVQGPIAATPVSIGGGQKTFKIFGQTVTIDETKTVFEDTSFDNLDVNDVVEISGFRSSPTAISASYVEWKERLTSGSSEVELRGTISGYASPTQQFMLDGFLITFDNATDFELESGLQADGLADGMFVEVEGIYYEADPLVPLPVLVHAEEIEEDDEGFGNNIDDISLQGVISNYVDIGDFQVNGQQVDASEADLSPANAAASLGDGVEVEVNGDIIGGKLMADELELRQGETQLKSFVSAVFPMDDRFEVSFAGLPGRIEIITNSQTLFDDESLAELTNFSVADMSVGDFVSVEGIESSNKVTAEIVKRLDKTDPDDSELQGRVDSFVDPSSITVLGVAYGVDGGTQFEDSTGSLSLAEFFLKVVAGDPVEIVDEVVANGTAEEVKLDD